MTSLAVDSSNVLLLTGDIEGQLTTIMLCIFYGYDSTCIHVFTSFQSTLCLSSCIYCQDSCACGELRTTVSTDLEVVDHLHHVWNYMFGDILVVYLFALPVYTFTQRFCNLESSHTENNTVSP